MQKLLNNSILSVLFFMTLLFLASCGTTVETVESVEVRTVQVKPPKPIVPTPDQLELREFKWIIVTPENIEEVFNNMRGEKVLFALTTSGYEAVSLNLSDVRALIQQQKEIIAIYENSF